MNYRTSIFIAFLSMPLFVHAQLPGMGQGDMQQMMEKAKEMQACFAKIDQEALIAIGEDMQKMEDEVRSLCKAGKRDQAQSLVLKKTRALSNDKNIIAAQGCGEMGMGMGMIPKMDYPINEKNASEEHLCDSF